MGDGSADFYWNKGYYEGKEVGRKEGYNSGRERGQNEGERIGFAKGRQAGYDAGWNAAVAEANKSIQLQLEYTGAAIAERDALQEQLDQYAETVQASLVAQLEEQVRRNLALEAEIAAREHEIATLKSEQEARGAAPEIGEARQTLASLQSACDRLSAQFETAQQQNKALRQRNHALVRRWNSALVVMRASTDLLNAMMKDRAFTAPYLETFTTSYARHVAEGISRGVFQHDPTFDQTFAQAVPSTYNAIIAVLDGLGREPVQTLDWARHAQEWDCSEQETDKEAAMSF
jgi:hypothetical protein